MLGADRLERLLEHADGVGVDHASRPVAPREAERGTGLALDVPELARGLARPPEGLLRLLGLAAVVLGRPEREQQLAALLRACPFHELERVEPAPVMRRRLLKSEQRHRVVAGPARVVDSLVRGAGRSGLEEVVRELGEVRLELRRVDILERLAHPAVQLEPRDRGDVLVEHVPDQHVSEAVAPDRAGDRRHDASGLRLG